ncbi:hypothetical protein HaLaN_14939, partial [Haematococcus lacustris]
VTFEALFVCCLVEDSRCYGSRNGRGTSGVLWQNGAAATMTATTVVPNLTSGHPKFIQRPCGAGRRLRPSYSRHPIVPTLPSSLSHHVHRCGYRCGVVSEVAFVPPLPNSVVAGAVEWGAHHTSGALDAPSPPTAPAQATTTSTFTTSQSCYSLLDNVVVPR